MGRLARSGRHFRNRPGRRPQHMTPYKRVIYPVDGFSSPCGYFIMQGIKTATRGAWRVLNGIQEASWTGAAHICPRGRSIRPIAAFYGRKRGFYPGNEKGGYMGAWRVMKCRLSRTPFITPSGRHCITLYRKLSSVFWNYFIYFIIRLDYIIHELYFLCIVQRDPALFAFQLAPF